jgi:uncharacterized repeat protein (TIGR01451 family)
MNETIPLTTRVCLSRIHFLFVAAAFASGGCASWVPPAGRYQHQQAPPPAGRALENNVPFPDPYTSKYPEAASPREVSPEELLGEPLDLEPPPGEARSSEKPSEAEESDGKLPTIGPIIAPPLSGREDSHIDLEIEAPAKKQVGTPTTFDLSVKNTAGRNLEDVSLVFEVEAPITVPNRESRRVSQRLATLAVNEERRIPVSVSCARTGRFRCQAQVFSGTKELVWKQVFIEFVPQQLTLAVVGPEERTVGARAEYTIKIANTSNRKLENVTASVRHADVLKQTAASVGSEKTSSTLHWKLGTLGAGEGVQLQVEFECPVITDHADVSVTVDAEDVPAETRELRLRVVGLTGILDLQVEDTDDPISKGGRTELTVTVHNRGFQAARNVELSVELPRGLKFVSGSVLEGERALNAAARAEEMDVSFAPVPMLGAERALTYRVVLDAVAAGDARVRVRVKHAAARSSISAVEVTTINP